MEYRDRHALFCAHARAVFSGDTAEVDRLQRLIYPSHLLAHQVFAFALFTVCADERFGEDLDWASMDVLIEGVRRTVPEGKAVSLEQPHQQAVITTAHDRAEFGHLMS